jgi:hypothetical protein
MPYEEPLDISAHEAIKFAEDLLRQHLDRPQGQ